MLASDSCCWALPSADEVWPIPPSTPWPLPPFWSVTVCCSLVKALSTVSSRLVPDPDEPEPPPLPPPLPPPPLPPPLLLEPLLLAPATASVPTAPWVCARTCRLPALRQVVPVQSAALPALSPTAWLSVEVSAISAVIDGSTMSTATPTPNPAACALTSAPARLKDSRFPRASMFTAPLPASTLAALSTAAVVWSAMRVKATAPLPA